MYIYLFIYLFYLSGLSKSMRKIFSHWRLEPVTDMSVWAYDRVRCSHFIVRCDIVSHIENFSVGSTYHYIVIFLGIQKIKKAKRTGKAYSCWHKRSFPLLCLLFPFYLLLCRVVFHDDICRFLYISITVDEDLFMEKLSTQSDAVFTLESFLVNNRDLYLAAMDRFNSHTGLKRTNIRTDHVYICSTQAGVRKIDQNCSLLDFRCNLKKGGRHALSNA